MWPPWAATLQPFAFPKIANVSSQHSRAVWLIQRAKYFYAITFGDGRHLLQSDRFTPDFGLRCVLNCIDADSFRAVRKRTLDSYVPYARHQSNEPTSVADFGLDMERDLVRGISASPKDADRWGARIEGSDSLHLSIRIPPTDLPTMLDHLDCLYASEDYKSNFGWIDLIRLVRNRTTIDTLTTLVKATLNDRSKKPPGTRCFLALPDLGDLAQVSSFRVTHSKRTIDDISFPALECIFPNGTAFDVNFLKSHSLAALDSNGQCAKLWPLWKCLTFETKVGDAKHILVEGNWFAIDATFEASIDAAIKEIPLHKGLPDYKHKRESEYNEFIAASEPSSTVLFDKQDMQISHGQGGSKFEFCDIYTKDRVLLHVKRFEGGAKSMSHLFMQGLSSARIWKSDPVFRAKVNELLPNGFRLVDPSLDIDPKSYHIVFGIISWHDGSAVDHLTFFSKIALKNVYHSLHNELGYTVGISTIRNITKVNIT